MEASVVSFVGEAMMCYKWERQRMPMRNWEDLKSLILQYFRPCGDGDIYEQWMSIEQTGTVAEYRKEFVTRLTYLDLVDEPVMLGAFLHGLREKVKDELSILGPTILDQVISWAEKIERKLGGQSWLGRRYGAGRNYQITPSKYVNQNKTHNSQ